jgi:hypothetical protein
MISAKETKQRKPNSQRNQQLPHKLGKVNETRVVKGGDSLFVVSGLCFPTTGETQHATISMSRRKQCTFFFFYLSLGSPKKETNETTT